MGPRRRGGVQMDGPGQYLPMERPASRLRRVGATIRSPPDLGKGQREVLRREVSTIRLFLEDVFGPLPAFCVSVKELVQWIRINKWELAKLLVVILTQLGLAVLMGEYRNYVFSQNAWPEIWLVSLGIFSGVVGFVATILVIRGLFLNKDIAIFAIVMSPITIGVSVALFSFSTYTALKSHLDVTTTSVPLLVSLIIWFMFVVLLPHKEAKVVGGNLVIAAVGIFATVMGGTLSALDPQSSMAGTLMGSGLTLIAMGLQAYYAERQKRPEATP